MYEQMYTVKIINVSNKNSKRINLEFCGYNGRAGITFVGIIRRLLSRGIQLIGMITVFLQSRVILSIVVSAVH